ncbi:MAG: arylamine N-acetyltransferase [Cyanobacteriota bacterium]|nr:arylamine N-acetyltransferase [Cyanobacteriota bacterium]
MDLSALSPQQVVTYLERLGYQGSLHPTPETLRRLQNSHLLAVPFENLDIHIGRAISIEPQHLFHKIVLQRRGGFCYELNGLLAELLMALGFQVDRLSAQVNRPDGRLGPAFDHLVLLVHLEHPWLVDVGFGDSFRDPLRLVADCPQSSYRLTCQHNHWRVEQSQPNGDWKSQFVFDLDPHPLSDFAAMCQFHQTSPESLFPKMPLCSIATPTGRVTLSKQKLIMTLDSTNRTEKGSEKKVMTLTRSDYATALATYFGVKLADREVERLWGSLMVTS